ncbi:MAG: sugar phosphate isomerase/epimerase, partial [Clostridia bacterium]|nr:sugar phosphate isomerase/epimerase [Clostridia bacterium]
MEYGIQMYSLRDLTPNDMEGALRTVAALGYKKVEYAGFFNNTAAQIVTWMDRFGLSVSGTHTGWQELKPENLAATVAY